MAVVVLIAMMVVPTVLAVWGFVAMGDRPVWRGVMLGLFVLGLAVGLWGIDGEWHPSATLRYVGYPFPHTVFQLRDGVWVDYPTGLAGSIVFCNLVLLAFTGPVVTAALFGVTRLIRLLEPRAA